MWALLFSNWRNIIIIGLGVVLAGALATNAYLSYRVDKVKFDLKTQVQISDIRQAQIDDYKDMLKNMQEHEARMQRIDKGTNEIKAQISKLKLEGRCIKDETYYTIADDYSNHFNDGLHKGDKK